jgi:sec-independent protein translocase protein TatA
MMGIGFPELMIILVIIMIIFGAGKLPEIGSAFGNSIKNFKKSMKEAEEIQEAAELEPTEIETDDNNSESLKEETAEESVKDKIVSQEAEKTTN